MKAGLGLAIAAMAALGAASPGLAAAPWPSMRVGDLIGLTPEEVATRMGLGAPASPATDLAAVLNGRRMQTMDFVGQKNADCPPGPDEFRRSGGAGVGGFLFTDGVLSEVFAPPPSTPSPIQISPALQRAIAAQQAGQKPDPADEAAIRAENQASARNMMRDIEARERHAPGNPPGPLLYESGVTAFDGLEARALGADRMIEQRCYPDVKPRMPPKPSPVEAAGLAIFDTVSVIYWSPYLLSIQADNADRAAARGQADAILPLVPLGSPVADGPAAFAKAHAERVRWYPAATPNYGVLTIDSGGQPRGWLGAGDDDHSFVVIGVRDGVAEWEKTNYSAGICLGADGQPSSVRQGCDRDGNFKP